MVQARIENNDTLVIVPVEGQNMTMGDFAILSAARDEAERENIIIKNIKAEDGIVFEGRDAGAYYGFTNAETIDISNIDMSSVKNAQYLFADMYNLKSVKLPPLPNLDNMSYMFSGCKSLETLDLTGVFTTEPRLMDHAFSGTDNLKDIITDKMFIDRKAMSHPNINTSFDANYYIRTLNDKEMAEKLWYIDVPLNCIEEVIRRGIFTQEDIDYIHDNFTDITKHPEFLLARDHEEYEYIRDNKLSYNEVLNLIANDREDSLSDNELKGLIDKKPDIEGLLEKLKTGELTACWSDFRERSLKKAYVKFLDTDGYVRADVKMKDLDERFFRFIRGIYKETGERLSFMEYITEINTKDINIYGTDLMLPYLYAHSSLQGFIPDNNMLRGMGEAFYNENTGNYDFPQSARNVWKLYNSSKAWCKNKETADAFFRVAKVFGVFEENDNKRQTGENYMRAITNYIPETIKLDGYSLAEMHPDMELEPIRYESEITIKPGLPYKAKKCHKALVKMLKEDEELTNLVGDVDKFLKKVEPLAELMDNSSVEDMPDGKAKDIMRLLVKDLYVNTKGKDIEVNKNDFKGEEGREALKKFRKLAESYAGDEDINMHVLDSNKVHAIFGGLKAEYNPDFAKFINNHMRDILYSDNPWAMGGKLTTIQKNWDYIQSKREMNRRQFHDKPAWKISFKEVEDILSGIIYDRDDNRLSDEKYDELAELCFSYRYDQEMFENCCDLYDKMCDRDHTSIPDIEGEYGNYHYKFLSLDDPAAIFFGQILDCCQQFGNAGESCMEHSCTSRDGRVFGVFDERGMMVAGSWTWRNGDTICFDNIEAANNPDIANIVEVYKDAAEKLRSATVEGDIINKVTVGEGYSDVPLNQFDRDTVNKCPVQDVEYINDSRRQRILSYSGRDDDIATRDLYEAVYTEHVNTTLGNTYESSMATHRNVNYGVPRDDDEEEEYEERHDEDVISDDIDDCEIIDRVEKFCGYERETPGGGGEPEPEEEYEEDCEYEDDDEEYEYEAEF